MKLATTYDRFKRIGNALYGLLTRLSIDHGPLLLIAAAWSFGIVTEDVVNNQWMTVVDLQVAAYLHARATPFLTMGFGPLSLSEIPIPGRFASHS